MLSEKQLIKKCSQYNIKAQRELYERYAHIFKRLCLRYIRPETDADDVLQEGFLKIYKNIGQYKGEGSFEGWMKRIMINTALYYCKKKNALKEDYTVDEHRGVVSDDSRIDAEKIDRKDIDENTIDYSLIENAQLSKKDIEEAVELLKDDFRIVFNLYFFENYKHQDIARLLDIDENTSRSRLARAKKMLQQELYRKSIKKMTM